MVVYFQQFKTTYVPNFNWDFFQQILFMSTTGTVGNLLLFLVKIYCC